MPRNHPFDLPPKLDELRSRHPLSRVELWDGSQAWLVTGWAEARAVLADNRFSADLRRPGFPRIRPGFRGTRSGISIPRAAGTAEPPTSGATMMRMDPPEHDVLRRMLMGHFTVRKVNAMRPMVWRMAETCLDDLQSRTAPADLIDAVALPLPSMVVCELLGVPITDRELFEEMTSTMLAASASQRQVIRSVRRLVEYFEDLISAKEKNPGSDIIGTLIRDYASKGLLSREDLVGTARLLLTAGHETTANMLGLSFLTLLVQDGAWEALRADPAAVPTAVEELLRYQTIAHTGMSRIATEDVELAGTTVRAGEGVIVAVAAANRDPRVFEDDADRFRPGRSARQHLSFGFGVHQCLGQVLARLELEACLVSAMHRLPSLALAGSFDDVVFREDQLIYGVAELKVTW